MSSSGPSSPIDTKFILMLLLVFGTWVGWQSHMKKKYPDAYKDKTTIASPADVAAIDSATKTQESAKVTSQDKAAKPTGAVAIAPTEAEKTAKYEDDTWDLVISSHGMAVKSIHLKKYTDHGDNPIAFAEGKEQSLFSTNLLGRREVLNFTVNKSGPNVFVGEATVGGARITKKITLNSKTYSIQTEVKLENAGPDITGLATDFSERAIETKSGPFFMPKFNHQEVYISYDSQESKRVAVDAQETHSESFANANIVGLGSQYFAVAIVDKSPVMPEFKLTVMPEGPSEAPIQNARGVLNYSLLNKADSISLNYTAFAGPKSIGLLRAIDSDLVNLVNLGFFNKIAKGVLWLMNKINSIFSNWGLTIIILTLLIRLIVLPLNIIGYKQMKAMSKIQPAMKALREKYKGDQQKLNQEMIILMKEAKANPVGGCLPMLVQIPVFFALYQVIGQSIELYKAPFIFWITDLSLKDPYYVLPVLMGATMWAQQKITPNTLEPAQQKIMMFLPVVFSIMMIGLPSALTLYIFVSTLFGVVQQFAFMRDNKPGLPAINKIIKT